MRTVSLRPHKVSRTASLIDATHTIMSRQESPEDLDIFVRKYIYPAISSAKDPQEQNDLLDLINIVNQYTAASLSNTDLKNY